MKKTIGRLRDQASVRQLHLDDLTLTYIVDGAMAMVPDRFLQSVPAPYWQRHQRDLADGCIPMSAGALLVERDGHHLLIDTGLGPLCDDDGRMKSNSGDLLKVLTAIGVRPCDIEVVAFTHLHLDHTGWAFIGDHYGPRRPTFPNAQYVIADAEMATLNGTDAHGYTPNAAELNSSLRQLSSLTLIGDGNQVAAGATAMVTPGHTPGHTSYIVTSQRGRRVVVFGDVFHTPPQISNPAWKSDPDSDPSEVPAARARVLAELAVPHTLGFGFHFGDQPFGRVISARGGEELTWQAIATAALLPPPRRL